MKKLLLSLLLLMANSFQAQNLNITDLNVSNAEGGINVNLHTLSLNGAGYINDSYEILGNSIIVKVCYWFDNTLPIIPFEENIMIPLEIAGDYTVTVNVVNSSTQEICDDFSLADSQTVVVSFLSTKDFQKEKRNLKLFPNPTNGILEFNDITNIDAVAVYDNIGRLIKEFRNLTSNKINLEGLSDGIYTLRFESKAGIHSQKIVFRK